MQVSRDPRLDPIAESVAVTTTYLTAGQHNPPACSGCAVGSAPVLAEAYLSDTHPAPNTTEGLPGKWTARFHFFESCLEEAAGSPHGQVAFDVQVP